MFAWGRFILSRIILVSRCTGFLKSHQVFKSNGVIIRKKKKWKFAKLLTTFESTRPLLAYL